MAAGLTDGSASGRSSGATLPLGTACGVGSAGSARTAAGAAMAQSTVQQAISSWSMTMPGDDSAIAQSDTGMANAVAGAPNRERASKKVIKILLTAPK